MKIWRAVALAATFTAACSGIQERPVRPGPSVPLTFSPPPGLVLINRGAEVRTESLMFPKGGQITVRQDAEAVTEERYEPLSDGGWRVKTTLLKHVSMMDGKVVPDQLSLVGITIVHKVDAHGGFVGVENAKEALDAIYKRLTTAQMRHEFEPMLTPEFISGPLERDWRARFDSTCGHELKPGDVLYSIDVQPVEELAPVRTLVRARVLGSLPDATKPGIELELEYGGRSADFVRSPGAVDALLTFPDGALSLTDHVSGEGRRVYDPRTCQAVSEESSLKGEARLNEQAAKSVRSIGLPFRVGYEVHRQLLRLSPLEARGLGIPTNPYLAAAPGSG